MRRRRRLQRRRVLPKRGVHPDGLHRRPEPVRPVRRQGGMLPVRLRVPDRALPGRGPNTASRLQPGQPPHVHPGAARPDAAADAAPAPRAVPAAAARHRRRTAEAALEGAPGRSPAGWPEALPTALQPLARAEPAGRGRLLRRVGGVLHPRHVLQEGVRLCLPLQQGRHAREHAAAAAAAAAAPGVPGAAAAERALRRQRALLRRRPVLLLHPRGQPAELPVPRRPATGRDVSGRAGPAPPELPVRDADRQEPERVLRGRADLPADVDPPLAVRGGPAHAGAAAVRQLPPGRTRLPPLPALLRGGVVVQRRRRVERGLRRGPGHPGSAAVRSPVDLPVGRVHDNAALLRRRLGLRQQGALQRLPAAAVHACPAHGAPVRQPCAAGRAVWSRAGLLHVRHLVRDGERCGAVQAHARSPAVLRWEGVREALRSRRAVRGLRASVRCEEVRARAAVLRCGRDRSGGRVRGVKRGDT
eukprot:Rhum_TRINITY_DN8574_c0_g1::Rhum_TRINITY_DN8574_c0_g1_i2::g.28508::m.28508